MAQRINKNTGYPMSTNAQIERARENLKYATSPSGYETSVKNLHDMGIDLRSDEQKCIDYIHSNFSKLITLPSLKAELAYKLGEWDTAEKEYLKIFFLDNQIADKLRIIYQKEKRYRDAYFIMNLTDTSVKRLPKEIGHYNDWVYQKFTHNLEMAKKKADKNDSKDKSILTGEKQIELIKYSNEILGEINQWKSDYQNSKKQN
ncbi:hypothetical protein [Lactobacillus amylovorus]|uniref:hypothetical protein n=1 Tax=Lactobacillus amylovorus TaxID=1604 RepID=UPI0023312A6F|nr:hypothetical protein [Lactobacillus amylovorus]MDB6232936.1 hypothetical protein [Lactobacillus amylovorus]